MRWQPQVPICEWGDGGGPYLDPECRRLGALWYYILYLHAQGSWGEILEEGRCKGQNRQAGDEIKEEKAARERNHLYGTSLRPWAD